MMSRRVMLGSSAALAGVAASGSSQAAAVQTSAIEACFDGLPGDSAFKIVAPATGNGAALHISSNASKRLFVGSAIKTFALAKAMTQADGPDIVATLNNQPLALNETVWNDDSASFNPPNLSGVVSERTTLEAMIMHSDNTATDMMFGYLGADKIRAFISSIGLKSTAVPDSTRTFSGYLLGAPDYKTFTWKELQAADASPDAPIVNSPLNDVETLASSCDDFVSYYSRALQGRFFKDPATLTEFRRILTLADVIYLLPFPLGASVFAKGGSIDVSGFHALCIPGGMYFNGRWVYFSFVINWYAAAVQDPDTVTAYLAAVSKAVSLVFDALSSPN